MNRLQKKCFIGATGLHLLLAVILLIGPAFLTTKSTTEDVPVLEFVPVITTDSKASGGGDPKGGMPPPAPVLPTPPTPIPPAPVVDKTPPAPEPPKKEKIKEVTPPDDKADVSDTAKISKHHIEVPTTPVIRTTDPQAAAKVRAAAEAKAADERKRIARAFNQAAKGIEGNLSGETSVVLKGPGGGGLPYGNWLASVKKVYTDEWIVPDGITDDSATVAASVTIARNGEVLSSSIVRGSGNSLVDQSVKATLDRVRNAPPLPEGAKEDQRTVTINFNVKAKQGLG